MSWSAKLLIGLVLIIVGAGAAAWSFAHYPQAARYVGIMPVAAPQAVMTPRPVVMNPAPPQPVNATEANPNEAARIASLEQRLDRVENSTERAEGFAGRADALVVAFAARRAIDRGVALGFLEPLLVQRFGAGHQQAVAAIVTNSRQPVRLNDLRAQFDSLRPALLGAGPSDGWWANFRHELGSVIAVHSADRPSTTPDARFERARARLSTGDVDQALAETMRLPGAARAGDWVAKARRYVAVHRALDEIESAALLTRPTPSA